MRVPWCSGLTCHPVKVEIAGSNPVGTANPAVRTLLLRVMRNDSNRSEGMIEVPDQPRKYWLWTVGCQMNKVDSDRIAAMLELQGCVPAASEEDADIAILNSCAVRESAERRVSGKLGNLVALKREKPGMLIALTGCSVDPKNELAKVKFPGADMYFGPTRTDLFMTQLTQFWPDANAAAVGAQACWQEKTSVSEHRGISAYVPISNGCDKFCTYCIVPYRRGRETSRPLLEIVDECGSLVKQGVKEITLLGQRVNAYGRDFKDGTELADLLWAVNEIPGLVRLRFLTSYPKDMSDRLIEAVSSLRTVCEHIHLPVQAGDDTVLENMRRGYTREEYLKLIARIREHVPGVAISTDIIVGFPGETEEQYRNTLSLLEEVRFSTVYVAAYSPRVGTLAARWDDDVPDEVKRDRLQRLDRLQQKISIGHHQALRNASVEVLVENAESERRDAQQWKGRTRTGRLVFFPRRNEDFIGRLVNVRISKVSPFAMQGEVVTDTRKYEEVA
jgi:tRNA-2-methylthio-N6-dimethylallyladenosine synthase